MRISETKVVQLIDSEPPELVIVDESTGAEITFTFFESERVLSALHYFLGPKRESR